MQTTHMCDRYWQQPRELVPEGVHVQNDLIKCYHTTNIQSSNGVDGDDELDLNELMLDETAILIPTEKNTLFAMKIQPRLGFLLVLL